MTKPLSTGCETNPARKPSRSSPAPTEITPVTRARPAVNAAARPGSPVSPATTTPESAALADIGPPPGDASCPTPCTAPTPQAPPTTPPQGAPRRAPHRPATPAPARPTRPDR